MDPVLEAAIDLFNRGRYLAAHELFEELWERSEGPEADLFKGLVQVAVALHHLEEANLAGARRLERSARRTLAAFLPTREGIDLERLLVDLGQALTGASRVRIRPATD